MAIINMEKLEALRGEFPGLFAAEWDGECLVRPDEVEVFRVSRVSRELLLVHPSCFYERGHCVCVEDEYRAFLLGEDFRVLAEVEPGVEDIAHGRSRNQEERRGEVIGDAILKLEDPTRVQYILLRHTGYDVDLDGGHRDSVGGYDVFLYKLSKKWSLAEWAVAERSRRARLGLTKS